MFGFIQLIHSHEEHSSKAYDPIKWAHHKKETVQSFLSDSFSRCVIRKADDLQAEPTDQITNRGGGLDCKGPECIDHSLGTSTCFKVEFGRDVA